MEGRFVSKDPIGFDGGINLYAYGLNNPINKKDPSGLRSITILDVPELVLPFAVYGFKDDMIYFFTAEYNKNKKNCCWKDLADNYSWFQAYIDHMKFDHGEAYEHYKKICK